MKQYLKRRARQLATKPFIGRFVQIGIAFVQLPVLAHRHNVFLNQQLPQLLDTLADINSRQTRLDLDQQNFVKTAPATLRKLTREVVELRAALQTYEKNHCHAAPENLARQQPLVNNNTNLRIHLTGGLPPLADYVNIDRRPGNGIDIVSEFDDLPIADSQACEIRSSRVLERFSQEHLRESLLPKFHRMLTPGGELRATVSDTEAMIREYSSGAWSFDDLRTAIYGRPACSEDVPRDMLTPQRLISLLEEAGFIGVQVLAQARPNGKHREFEIVAHKEAVTP